MSGTDLVDSAQDAGVRPPSSNVSEDQAASLRAAALMTLKSKRRKTTTSQAEPMLPHRSFAAPPTIELDYGQEETAGPSSLASSPVVAPVKPTKSLPVDPAPMEVDDVATREEGEISDSELAPSTPKAKSEPRSPTLAKTSSVVQGQPKQPRGSTPPSIAALPPANIIPQASVPSMTSPLVDEDHVRPGLALTQEQYDTAKDIVLDLLGWGVPPEYLVSCGLSRELVYYVFVELNLRLPSNLDTIGLPALSSSPSPQPISSSANHPRASLSHPSLPPKPQSQEVVSVGANGPHPLSAAATPFIPAGSDSAASVTSPGTNLHDMEQQRRQELLARKAVLASRRPKPKIVPVASSSRTTIRRTHTQDEAVPNGTVPTKLVDDFLQSIEPVATPSASSSGQATPLPGPSRSMYDMDVDDVPGLTTSHAPITEYTPLPRLPPPGLVAKSNSTSPRSPPAPQSAVSTESGRPFHYSSVLSFANSSTSYEDNDDDMDAIPGLFQSRSLPEDSVGNSRRGTKRPVAADFVDMEPAPARIQLKGPPDFFRATIRRKTAGFAGLTQRRCVIDLSDSEDDDSREPRSEGVLSRTDSRGPKAENSQTTIVPTPRTRSPIITPSITPATLHEKEEEIRRMRELIALREQSRKKKLIVSTRSTPTSSSTPTNGTVSVKQEEDDSVGVRSFGSSRSGSSATPDPSTNGRRYDSQEERSVLDTLLPHESYQNGTVSLPNSASTSNPATPIDVSSRTLEHSTTGDKVLTDEARLEQVVSELEARSAHGDHMEVDVVGYNPETSTQDVSDAQNENQSQESQQASEFASYHSLLDCHPLLREHSGLGTASRPSSDSLHSGSSSGPHSWSSIDFGLLKHIGVVKYLSSGSGRLCQYEVPGGGECRVKDCKDVHLSRISSVEPSDEDIAQYLCSSIPIGPRLGVKAFRDALDVARLRHPTMTFDARIQEALVSLGLP